MKPASRQDLPALISLWETCFGDSRETVTDFFDALYDCIRVFTDEDLGSMAVAMPVQWQGKKSAYLYAVCTAPALRGQGRSRRLLQAAEEALRRDGCSYALLVPADEGLFRFYGAQGYEPSFFCRQETFSPHAPAVSPVKPVSAAAYDLLRRQQLPDGVQYPEALLAYQAAAGCLLELPSLGCAAIERTATGFLARELLSPDPQAAADALCAFLRCAALPARMPGDSPFGMAKSLDGSPLRPGFLGLDFS